MSIPGSLSWYQARVEELEEALQRMVGGYEEWLACKFGRCEDPVHFPIDQARAALTTTEEAEETDDGA